MGLVAEFFWLFILLGVVFLIWGWFTYDPSNAPLEPKKKKYHYTRKHAYLTPEERSVYEALSARAGAEYQVFAHVPLTSLVDFATVRQDVTAARDHISGRAVDFVLVRKSTEAIALVVQIPHEKQDARVAETLKDAGIPLLVLQYHGTVDQTALMSQINANALQ